MSRLLAFLFLCGSLNATEILFVCDKMEGGVWGTALGTAVIVGRKGDTYSAVTARHVIQGGYDGRVIGSKGKYPIIEGHPLKDPSLDFALIRFKSPNEEFKLTKLADAEPKIGEAVTWSGYSDGTRHQRMSGVYAKDQGNHSLVIGEREVRQGQSGGGVYRDGKLIGIVSVHIHENDTHETYMGFVPMCRANRGCQREWGWHFGIGIPPAYPPTTPYRRPPQQEAAPPPPVDPKPTEPQADYSEQIDSLRTEIERLKASRIPVQILNPDGTIHDQATYKLGNPLKFKLSPKK